MFLAIDVNGVRLTDDALLALIGKLNQAQMDLATDNVVEISAEGRTLRFTSNHAPRLSAMIRDAVNEAQRRGIDLGVRTGGSLPVEISR